MQPVTSRIVTPKNTSNKVIQAFHLTITKKIKSNQQPQRCVSIKCSSGTQQVMALFFKVRKYFGVRYLLIKQTSNIWLGGNSFIKVINVSRYINGVFYYEFTSPLICKEKIRSAQCITVDLNVHREMAKTFFSEP